jgi:hypothetical protein
VKRWDWWRHDLGKIKKEAQMKAVWKHDIPTRGAATEWGYITEMPQGARFLSSAIQYNQDRISAWFEVDPEAPKEHRTFRVYGTGHPLEGRQLNYLGTTLHHEGTLVLHLYEEA